MNEQEKSLCNNNIISSTYKKKIAPAHFEHMEKLQLQQRGSLRDPEPLIREVTQYK